jgi:hypothetical protein
MVFLGGVAVSYERGIPIGMQGSGCGLRQGGCIPIIPPSTPGNLALPRVD